jgi:predicted ATPase
MGIGVDAVEEVTLRGRAEATRMLTLTGPDGTALEALPSMSAAV